MYVSRFHNNITILFYPLDVKRKNLLDYKLSLIGFLRIFILKTCHFLPYTVNPAASGSFLFLSFLIGFQNTLRLPMAGLIPFETTCLYAFQYIGGSPTNTINTSRMLYGLSLNIERSRVTIMRVWHLVEGNGTTRHLVWDELAVRQFEKTISPHFRATWLSRLCNLRTLISSIASRLSWNRSRLTKFVPRPSTWDTSCLAD